MDPAHIINQDLEVHGSNCFTAPTQHEQVQYYAGAKNEKVYLTFISMLS